MDALHRIDAYLAREAPPTPCLVVDLLMIRHQYHALHDALPDARIYYAVKANPAVPVLEALSKLDIGFDLASTGEINRCLALGIPVDRFCFGNTIKRERDIGWAHSLGVDLFAFDSPAELDKLARSAPGARVFCRLSVNGRGAEWPLTRKFGCSAPMAVELLVRAKVVGLRPVGVSFHVGSQQTDPMQWALAIARAARVFRDCARQGVTLEVLNVGGGLPAQYRAPIPPLASYAEAILSAVSGHFGSAPPRIMVEPGRFLVGDAGLLRSQVLLIARHGRPDRRWVYLDVGRYNGLAETQGEAIQYRLRTAHAVGACEPVVLAGPTCDSTDIIYDHAHYALPLDLAIGDSVDCLSAGAYTASYASVEFNGFPPLAVHCI
jgi:ornithine decarboxylase